MSERCEVCQRPQGQDWLGGNYADLCWSHKNWSRNEEAHVECYRLGYERLLAERDRLREVLRGIAAWKLPRSGKTWPDGTEMSFGAAFGSNGERDHFRALARAALEPPPKEGEG